MQPQTPSQLGAAFYQRQDERHRARRALPNGNLRIDVVIGEKLLSESLTKELAAFNETVETHTKAEKARSADFASMLTGAESVTAETTAATSAALRIRQLELARQPLVLLGERSKLLPKVIGELETQLESSRKALEKLTADVREMIAASGFHPPTIPLNSPAAKERFITAAANSQDDVRDAKAATNALREELERFRHQRAAISRDRESLLGDLGDALLAVVGRLT